MVLALRCVATAPQDPWGRLQVSDAPENSMTVGGRLITALCWENMQNEDVLQPTISGSGLFVFAARGLMHYALLLAARDAVLTDAPLTQAASKPRTAAEDAETRGTATYFPEPGLGSSLPGGRGDPTCAHPRRAFAGSDVVDLKPMHLARRPGVPT